MMYLALLAFMAGLAAVGIAAVGVFLHLRGIDKDIERAKKERP